jgi:hypothetical protein
MQYDHFLDEDPRKCPFEVIRTLKRVAPGMNKPELPWSNVYFTLGFYHEARTPEENARFV